MPQKSVNAAKSIPIRIFDFNIRLHLIFYASYPRAGPELFLVQGVFCFFASGKVPSSYKLFVHCAD